MAVTTALVFQGQNIFVTDVTWGADADTTADIAHGLGASGVPLIVFYTPLASGAAAAVPIVGCTVIDATKITVAKVNVSAGSGAAAKGRLTVMRPHSLIE
jgi:hypothetical protein